jgi:hypothetical protein
MESLIFLQKLRLRQKMKHPEARLDKIVSESGEVISVYGGFKIRVIDPSLLPWYQIFDQLIEIGQEVWINKTGGQLYVNSKPKIA